MKVVFFDEWDTPAERLKGATEILRSLSRSRSVPKRHSRHCERKRSNPGRNADLDCFVANAPRNDEKSQRDDRHCERSEAIQVAMPISIALGSSLSR
jgi:hypothetical protein